MFPRRAVVALGACLLAATSAPADAAPDVHATAAERPRAAPIPAASNALELSFGTGYTQGFGSLERGVGFPSVAEGGVAFGLGIGYRIDPRWAVLWSGELQEFDARRATGARGFTSSIAGQVHLAPTNRVDPWAELGAGYRILWEDFARAPVLVTHGFQLGRLRVGVDFRAGRGGAVGPVVGADLNLLLFQDAPSIQADVRDVRLSTFVFAGMQARFDL